MISSNRPRPVFQPGQLVRHRRYGYRGVVVDYDEVCRASDGWYQRNRSQPERDQPWYHVLVHESDMTTYAAQTSLEADPDVEPIVHPLLAEFFEDFTGQSYRRNDRPWQI